MMPGNVFGRPVTEAAADTAEPIAGPVTRVVGGDDPADADAGRRVDLGQVLTGLRHLSAAAEPARVFTELAAVCVPALCDECLIEIVEQGGHRYRIRRPGPGPGHPAATTGGTTNPAASNGAGLDALWPGGGAVVTVTGQSVIARFGNPPGGGPDYTGQLVCTWRHGHVPVEADAALVGVLVDHATALVHRERTTTTRLADPDVAGQVRLALDGTQRVAAATGILMALYHLSPVQARRLLARAGDHTHRSLREVADTVLRTGTLPGHHGRPIDQFALTPPGNEADQGETP